MEVDGHQQLKAELKKRLLSSPSVDVPTSTLARLSRTAVLAVRAGGQVYTQGRTAAAGARGEGDEAEWRSLMGLVGSIGELKGMAMKLGQMMSYIDLGLPDELAAALSVLQTHSQPMSTTRVREVVTEDLGMHAAELLAHLEPQPLAAASIGQVHRARLASGIAVALKVQYPGIARAIANDFRPAAVGTKVASLLLPSAKVDSLVQEARERFLDECNYLHEAHAQQRFACAYRGHPTIVVPEVHVRLCSRRVLTTTLMEGAGLDEWLAGSPSVEDRRRMGVALFDFYLGALYRHRLYNSDPHPGNYLFRADGRLAMLDYGCVRELDTRLVGKIARLTRAVHRDDRTELQRSFVELGMVREHATYDFDLARTLARSLYGPMLHDGVAAIDTEEVGGLRDLRQAGHRQGLTHIALTAELLFLLRLRVGLMSVLARLGAEANWFRMEQALVV